MGKYGNVFGVGELLLLTSILVLILSVPEEEPILDQAPAALVGFAPQWIGGQILNNNNGWQEEDLEEVHEDMVNNEEDDTEVINPYEEANPHNPPPPTSDEETEFASHVVQIFDADDVSIPPVIQFGKCHRGVMKLSKKMHDRYRMEKKMARKFRQDKLRINGQEFDITALDSAVRENSSESSKMMKLITGLSREFTELKNQNRMAEQLNAAMDTQGDEDVDTDAPWDTQPFEPCGSPRDSQDERESVRMEATRVGGPARGRAAAPMARECSYIGFMKCGPTQFHGNEGAVGLVRWFKKMENNFEISECAEGKKVKFTTATFHGRALTWWNSQVATLGREVAHGRPWTEVKQMMTDEFCLTEEVQRLEDKLKHLKLRDMNIAAYTERMGHKAKDCQSKNVASGSTVQSNVVCYECGERGHKSCACPKKADRRGGNVQGQAYVIRDAEHN
nr:putative zinc finger, CCHC-type, retrotransposon Gag domain protein [Tanacetum cinerariifolium]